jgi:hypothetical protein
VGFWETAAAAFVGGVAVLLIGSLVRFGWFYYRMRHTAFGRHTTRAGMLVEQALSDAEQHEGET